MKQSQGSVLKSNLAIALYLLPRGRRKAAFRFYTFCHRIDACVDHSSLTQNEKKVFLKTAFEKSAQDFSEHQALIKEIIHGMEMDLTIQRYETFEELRGYAWRVASAVGLISAKLFGATGEAVEEYAEQLGLALQFTNILRDVAEDAARDRIYLPLEDLRRFEVSEKEILQGIPSPKAIHLFHYEAERALSYFAKTNRTWEKMTTSQRRLMRPARAMEAIYRALLEKMQRDRYDLFYRRYQVGIAQKIALIFQVIFFT